MTIIIFERRINIRIKDLIIFSLALLLAFSSHEIKNSNGSVEGEIILEETKTMYGFRRAKDVNFNILETGIKVKAKSKDGLWGLGGLGEDLKRILYKLDMETDEWIEVYKFDKRIKGIHINDRDDIIVSIGNKRWEDNSDSEIYMSKDKGNSFEKVLDVKSGVVLNWNMASDEDGYMFISEYGNKNLKDNPRRIYRSKDYGENFEIVFSPLIQDGYHNHVLTIDKDNPNNIYQVIGDDDKYLMKSEDRGDSFFRISSGYHPTSAIQIDDKIIFGLDGYPFSGFIIYNKRLDKIVYEYKLPEPFKGSIYNMLVTEDGTIYAGALSYSYQDWPGSIFMSRDKGRTWDLVAYWEKEEDYGVGIYDMFEWGDYIYLDMDMGVFVNGEMEWHEATMKMNKIKQ